MRFIVCVAGLPGDLLLSPPQPRTAMPTRAHPTRALVIFLTFVISSRSVRDVSAPEASPSLPFVAGTPSWRFFFDRTTDRDDLDGVGRTEAATSPALRTGRHLTYLLVEQLDDERRRSVVRQPRFEV